MFGHFERSWERAGPSKFSNVFIINASAFSDRKIAMIALEYIPTIGSLPDSKRSGEMFSAREAMIDASSFWMHVHPGSCDLRGETWRCLLLPHQKDYDWIKG
ncbi:hypothetical protein AKJ16_DCAP11849 [Drosera capensis]